MIATIAVLIAALSALTTAVGTLVIGWRASRRVQVALVEQKKDTAEIHVLVDGRMSDMVARVDQLMATLKEAKVPVPAPETAPDKLS